MRPRDVEKTLGERRRRAIRLGEGRLRRRTTSKPFVDRGVVVTDRRGVARSIHDRFGDAEESAEGNANLLLVPAAESVVVVEHDVAEFLVRLDVGDHPRSRGAVLPEHAHARADGRSERRGGDASVVRRTGVGVGRAPIYDAGHAPILRPAGDRARARSGWRGATTRTPRRIPQRRRRGRPRGIARSRARARSSRRSSGHRRDAQPRRDRGERGEPRPPPRHPPKPRSRSARAHRRRTRPPPSPRVGRPRRRVGRTEGAPTSDRRRARARDRRRGKPSRRRSPRDARAHPRAAATRSTSRGRDRRSRRRERDAARRVL